MTLGLWRTAGFVLALAEDQSPSIELRIAQARCLLRTDASKALLEERLNELCAERPDDLSILLNTFEYFVNGGRVEPAVEEELCGRLAARLDELDAQQVFRFFRSYFLARLQSGDPSGARAAAALYLARRPNSVHFLHCLARAFMEEGRHAQAIGSLKKAHFLDSTDLQVLVSLAECFYVVGDEVSAAAMVKSLLKIAPDSDVSTERLEEVMRQRGLTREATVLSDHQLNEKIY